MLSFTNDKLIIEYVDTVVRRFPRSILASILSGRDFLGLPLGLLLLVLGHGDLVAEPRDVWTSSSRSLGWLGADHQRLALLAWFGGTSENLAVGLRKSNLAVDDGLQRRVVLFAVFLVPVLNPRADGSRGDGISLAVLRGLQIIPHPLVHVLQLHLFGITNLVMLLELGLGHDVRAVVLALGEFESPRSTRIVFVGDDACPASDEVVCESAGEAGMSGVVGVVGALPQVGSHGVLKLLGVSCFSQSDPMSDFRYDTDQKFQNADALDSGLWSRAESDSGIGDLMIRVNWQI